MKYCEEYVPALSALIDGELSDAERAGVLAHLDECEGCRAYFAELTAMRAALAELEEYDAPEGFSDGVMARLREVAPKRRAHRAAWFAGAACAAVAALVLASPLRGHPANTAVDGAIPEAAMMTMMAAPQTEERAETDCADEEYTDTVVSLQSAPMTITTCGRGEAAENNAAVLGDYAAETPAELPRSVVSVYGASREDYLIEAAVSFSYFADGSAAGYDLPVEKLDELLALLDADGLAYESSVARQATTFYVQYEEASANE